MDSENQKVTPNPDENVASQSAIESLIEALKAILEKIKNLFSKEQQSKRKERRAQKREQKDSKKSFNIIERKLSALEEQVREASEQGDLTQGAVEELAKVVRTFDGKINGFQGIETPEFNDALDTLEKQIKEIAKINDVNLLSIYSGKLSDVFKGFTDTSKEMADYDKYFEKNARVFAGKDKQLFIELDNKMYEIKPEFKETEKGNEMLVSVSPNEKIDKSALKELGYSGVSKEYDVMHTLSANNGYYYSPKVHPKEMFAMKYRNGDYSNGKMEVTYADGSLVIKDKEKEETLTLREEKNGGIDIFFTSKDFGMKDFQICGIEPDENGNSKTVMSVMPEKMQERITSFVRNEATIDYLSAISINPEMQDKIFSLTNADYKSQALINVEAEEKVNKVFNECKQRFGADSCNIITHKGKYYVNIDNADNSRISFSFNERGDMKTINYYDSYSNDKKQRPEILYQFLTQTKTEGYYKNEEKSSGVLLLVAPVLESLGIEQTFTKSKEGFDIGKKATNPLKKNEGVDR